MTRLEHIEFARLCNGGHPSRFEAMTDAEYEAEMRFQEEKQMRFRAMSREALREFVLSREGYR